MKDHRDLKSVEYIDAMKRYVETAFRVRFKKTGATQHNARCPFHAEIHPSFFLYVKKDTGEVRFHCLGECKTEWDIYDLIRLREKCGFKEAQQVWADYLGVKDFVPYGGDGSAPEPEPEQEPDDTVEIVEPAELDQAIVDALVETAGFYHDLLLSNADRFEKVWQYLSGRGVGEDTVRKFKIGYAPPYSDPQYQGRALIEHFLPRFKADYKAFQPFSKGGLVRMLMDASCEYAGYFRRQVDFSRQDLFTRAYGDFFAGRIVFPIYDAQACQVGFVGRRPDNRSRYHWIKQRTTDIGITTRGWLFGIDKAQRYIRQYRTVILVEGIFDYFAFYNLLQDQDKPVVVSTLGSKLTAEALGILKGMGVEHFIVAYDCDPAGRSGIARIVEEVQGSVYFLGGLAEGQDPHDLLKPAINKINGFSLQRLMDGAKKAQPASAKPVNVHILTSGPRGQRDVVFELETGGAERATRAPVPPPKGARSNDLCYDAGAFLPLLTYNHGNKALLDQRIGEIVHLLENGQVEGAPGQSFKLPYSFLRYERHTELGPALILWLRIAIEQQAKKRRIKATDAELAEWLDTSRVTVSAYKRRLKSLGFLNIDTSKRPQKLSVWYRPKTRSDDGLHDAQRPAGPSSKQQPDYL